MTFKIDKVGFYKNRDGEKIQIRQLTGQGWYADDGWFYEDFGANTIYNATPDIIAHWEEPVKLEELLDKLEKRPKNKFYLIFNPSQSAPKHRHYTLEEAQKEARRIAARHPEQTVYVLETIAAYKAEVEIKEIKI